ncbi:hypothetical protein GY45DRAFT_1326587 [Cubamyces sp. BRFM 1775]|nr:hypothetical protein GY45DRAFT_1326587 [Cubamyces sp. BRFM 1775]
MSVHRTAPPSQSNHGDEPAWEIDCSVRGMLSSRHPSTSPTHSLQEEQLERMLRMHDRVLAVYERSLIHWQSAFHRPEHSRSLTPTRSPYHNGASAPGVRERSLEHWDRLRPLEEETTRIANILQGVEKQLALLRASAAMSSTTSLAPSHLGENDNLPGRSERGFRASDVEKAATTAARSVQAKPYPHRPYAAGLHTVRRCSEDWNPCWEVFPLKAFRGSSYTYIKISAKWDDEDLLRELGRSYDKLRTIWRKWFSLRSVRSITMVYADHTCIYPKRLGPAGVSPSKNMRLRYCLHHPELMKDRREFM